MLVSTISRMKIDNYDNEDLCGASHTARMPRAQDALELQNEAVLKLKIAVEGVDG